jgi:hypothetical protein
LNWLKFFSARLKIYCFLANFPNHYAQNFPDWNQSGLLVAYWNFHDGQRLRQSRLSLQVFRQPSLHVCALNQATPQ